MSASELAGRIRTKDISCREVMKAFLENIAKQNPQINAIIEMLEPTEALAMADEADEVIAKGKPLGALHGIPIAVKEMVDVKGWKTTYRLHPILGGSSK